MKHTFVYLRAFIALCTFLILAACGGGSSEETPTETPNEPTPAVAESTVTNLVFGDSEVEITWTHPLVVNSTDPVDISYTLYYAEEQIEIDVNSDGEPAEEDLSLADLQARINGLAGSMVEENVTSPFKISGTNNTSIYFVITATTADGTSDPTNELRATPRNYNSSAVVTYNINDSGYTECGDFSFTIDVNNNGTFEEGTDILNSGEHDNHINCIAGDLDDDGDTLPEVTAQDAFSGRDFLAASSMLAKTGAGLAGFDFTKLDTNGAVLAVTAPSWSCVRDNHTGLIWEVKTTDEGLHNAADRYTWYNTDTLHNGGNSGVSRVEDFNTTQSNDSCFGYDEGNSSTYCNTQAFVERVNAAGLCGANDWRMPSREELVGIVEYRSENDNDQADPIQRPSIDTDYFPNTQVTQVTEALEAIRYLSGSPVASAPTAVWAIYFGAGGSPALSKGQINAVRLVRDAP